MKTPVRPMSAGESLMPRQVDENRFEHVARHSHQERCHRGALPNRIELVHLSEQRSWLLHELFMQAAVHWKLFVSEVAEQQTTPGGPDLAPGIPRRVTTKVAAAATREARQRCWVGW